MAQDWALAGMVVALLAVVTAVGQIIKRQPQLGLNPAAVKAFNGRIRSWWIICCLLSVAFLPWPWVTIALFGFLSFWALREFITLTPTRMGDHRALFWVFFLFTPLQYVLVAYDNYALYSTFIPVYAFLFIPARIAIAGDPKRFLERVAKIQSGLLVCVYCLSFAPAVLNLENVEPSKRPGLLFFFVTMVLFSEAAQFILNRTYGSHVIAPNINATRTWEGLLGGAAGTALVAWSLSFVLVFTAWQAALVGMIIAVMGSAGAMTMSAIKRDRGVSDYGTLVEGHGGVLDRIDAICFAAPVFYHVTKQILS